MNPTESSDNGQTSGDPSTENVTLPKDNKENKNKSHNNIFEDNNMKRAAVKELIEKYFYQVTDGCGNETCDNETCRSSGKLGVLSANEAAGMALKLWSTQAKLCNTHQTKIARTTSIQSVEDESQSLVEKSNLPSDSKSLDNENSNTESLAIGSKNKIENLLTESPTCSKSIKSVSKDPPKRTILTEKKLYDIIENCKANNNYTQLRSILYEVFTNKEFLSQSFNKANSKEQLTECIPEHVLNQMSREQLEQYSQPQTQLELCSSENLSSSKIDDSSSSKLFEVDPNDDSTSLDLDSLNRAYELLFNSVPTSEFESTLVEALVSLSELIDVQLISTRLYSKSSLESCINVFLIIFNIPALGGCDYVERALPKICKAASQLPLPAHARIARIWSKYSEQRLKTILEALQQLITIKTISGHYHKNYTLQDEESITAPTKIMRILYYANILAGELEPTPQSNEDVKPEADDASESIFGFVMKTNPKNLQHEEDPLAKLLKVNKLDCIRPLIPFVEFYNEPLSDTVEMDKDFGNYKASEHFPTLESGPSTGFKFSSRFSFMHYSFILTPATKTLGLYYDNRIRMYSERRFSFVQTVAGQPSNPYLRLKVRRDHIIEDALVELEMIAMENDNDLKKQLVVEFEGEQGIDEGGVSKEFFQLVVESIFNPDFGMFCQQGDTGNMWFNPTSFESDAQFTLIGIVLGLALYNNVILDVHFPMVVYRKLMGRLGAVHDLEDFNPGLYSGLKDMLNYSGDDIYDVFMQTFRICYTDPFGSVLHHDLLPGGDNIQISQDNKQEFVKLYADFLLNSSVKKQFNAFKRGFQMVTDESPLALLFRPEEIEQLVCGSKIFDLSELEDATEYDGGYTSESPIIQQFWEIVHAMPHESQKKLLQFTTGSDRIPVGGLSKLKMIIARGGPDSDRLPTAHTCFNVLLLPEYTSKEKLHERLLKAINYSKGFGML